MNQVAVFASAGLPAVATLKSTLGNLKVDVGNAGTVILKMDKTGAWVYGADQDEVEDGSEWAVNPFSFVHGYIAWGTAEGLGEKMTGVAQPLPELDEAPKGAQKGWEMQVGMSLKCISGEDKDMDVRYATTSVGGKKAVQAIAAAIAEQVNKDESKPVPIVTLKKDHYQHKSYGKIYTPVFEIVEWVGLDGAQEEVAVEAEPEAPAAGRRRRSV
jgi:hypothetical protein